MLAGPMCAMIAGDLGADVIKVEGPDGDPVRALAPPTFGHDATYYLAVNRHRRNIVADLKDPSDFARILELVKLADAVVENFLPNQVRALGIERLREANPECVWVSVTPATSGGPVAGQPSFDLLAQARSGLMGVTGDAAGPPVKVGAPNRGCRHRPLRGHCAEGGSLRARARSRWTSLRGPASRIDDECPRQSSPGLSRDRRQPRATG
ncbi:MAG: hypothetical protein HIU84_08750 [Acidobacteria bacterium]|nr:hypothetical protein [Acidobacteriota bacterium]